MNNISATYGILSILEQIEDCEVCPLNENCDDYMKKEKKTICEELRGKYE